jgi:ankyrin repeat protein
VAITLANLGSAYGALGKAQRQRECLERALSIEEGHYGSDSPELVVTLMSLSDVVEVLGDVQKAYELLQKILKIKNDWTPLHAAARSGYAEAVKILLDNGEDFLARNDHDTVLHQAVHSNNTEIIELILTKIKEKFDKDEAEMYVHINAQDTEGDTPLMWAAEIGRIDAAKTLLKYGADVTIKNKDNITALNWATKNGHLELAMLLTKLFPGNS